MKKVWLIAAVGLACTMGAGLGACSSSGGTGNSASSSSSSSSSTGSSSSSSGTGGSSSSSSSSSSSGSGGSDAGSTCQSDPSIHTAAAGSIFCGFDADGGDLTCTTGNECCIGGTITGGYAADQCSTW